MNEQELMNVSASTASSPAPASPENVPQIAMPVYYINQPVKPSGTPTSTTDMPTPILFGTGNGNPKRFAYTNQQLVYTTPICRSFAGNQIIKLATTTSGGVQYVPVGQVYPPSKAVKDNNSKKLFVTSINSAHNNKSNQVNLIIPSNQTTTSGNKPPITNLTLPNTETVPNKGTLTLVPNNPAGVNTNKQTVTSLLLPANTKYPNIAPNKKLFIPHILPQQNVTPNKQTNVPNIIRQTNNPTSGKNVVGIFASNSTNQQMTSLLLTQNANNKNPQSSLNLILPTSAGSHGLIVPHSVAGQTHSILVSQSSATQNSDMMCTQTSSAQAPQAAGNQAHGIIMAPTSEGQAHLANVVLTTNSTHATTPVTSLLISNNSSNATTMGVNSASQTTSILVPVSMGPNSRPTHILAPQVGPYNKKTTDKSSSSREKKQSVLSKGGVDGNFPSLPPLQPISSKDGVSKSLLANGLNVPNSLVMTPITDGESLKSKLDRISDEMTIERTPSLSADERGTSMSMSLRADEKMPKTDEEICKFDKKSRRGEEKSDMGASMTCLPPLRGSKGGDVLLDDGEMTISMTRLLGPSREEYLEKLQLDYDMTIEVVKPEKPKIPPPRYQKPEDLDPMDVLEWDQQGVGKLPGSNIKFRINEFGLDLVVDSNKEESTTNTPNSSRRNSDERQKSPTPSPDDKEKGAIGEGPDKIYCCEGCGCYGLYTEFLTDTRFCSVGCKKIVIARNEMKKKRMDDKMRELRLRRKRRKIKILAQRARKGAIIANSKEQFMEKNDDQLDKADINKAWANKMAELRRAQKSSEGKIKINMSDEDSRAVTPVSDSEASENISRSSIPSVPSEDDASSDKTAELKETNFLSSSGEFLWSSYLHKVCNKAKAAPVKLFKDPFPYGKNGFKVGMKLEGIDPEHQAIISVLTVAQVKGHRIRLHFDGFPDLHDFWTNSDSPDIFPPGWCERNNHTLDPPRGYSPDTFNWNSYLKQCRASPAPKGLFPKSNAPLCPSQFRAGMKLEAVDRKNSSLICVASVSNLIDNRLLIHFDSWGDVYDYWADPTSPYIHPVGWCEENGYDLTPPNNFKMPTSFSWEAYLKETKAAAAPARAFKPRPPNAFRRGMKLEAIDKRSPSFLRPATVKEVKDYQIKIGFDGYPEEFGYWVDDDCTDIHPCGWGHKTGYPVTPPPMMGVKSECGTEGCTGDGNMKGGFLTRHTSAIACPYSTQNLERENFPDRFCANPGFYEVPEPISKSKGTSTKQDGVEDSSSSESRVKTRLSSSSQKDENKQESHEKSAEPEEKTEERVERRGRKRKLPDAVSRVEQQDKLRKELIQTVFDPGYRPVVKDQEMWTKHVATLGHKVTVTGGDPRSWNHKQVAAFVNTVIPSRAKLFLDQEIDGESFLMLTQVDLTKVLGLKLGPAIKIYNCIILLRQKVMSL